MSGVGSSSRPGWVLRGLTVGLFTSAVAVFPLRAAVADFWIAESDVRDAKLSSGALKQADAVAHYLSGLFEEESEGPEKALDSKRRVLELDPAYSQLAVEVAYEYLRRGDTAEAISVLKDSVKAAPKDSLPCLALASIYLRHLRKPELASKYAQLALTNAPDAIGPYEILWEIHQSLGEKSKAAAVLERAGKRESADPTFWLALAELHGRGILRGEENLNPSDSEKITSLLQKAADLGNDDPAVLAKVADFFVMLRRVDAATPFYERLVAAQADYPGAREKLATAYIQAERIPEAIGMLEQIVAANPLDLAAYDQLAKLYVRAGNEEKALGAAEQALVMEPYVKSRHIDVVDLLFKLRRFDRAAERLAEARKRFPQTGVFAYYHGMALSQAKQHDDAMRAFEQASVEAANVQPEMLNGEFYFDYGAAAEQAGRYVKAEELFRKSIELDPINAGRSYNYLGYMWVERNERLDEAEELIRKALTLEPDNGAYIDSLGWLHYKKGRYEEALKELLRAAERLIEPDPVVYDHIGDACAKLNKTAEAVLYWQKALQLDPESQKIAAKIDKAAEKVAQQPKPVEPTPRNPPN